MSIVKAAEDFARQKLEKEVFEHTLRVRNIALKLLEEERGDKEIVELAALLHDIGYIEGFNNHDEKGVPIARKFFAENRYELAKTGKVLNCILKHGSKVAPETIEEKIIWDADCIDRLGALGIIRMTANQIKYKQCNAEELPAKIRLILESSANGMKTNTARNLAKQLISFQKQFFKELNSQMGIINNNFDFFYRIIEEEYNAR